MRASSLIPFLIVIGIGVFEFIEHSTRVVEANKPDLMLIDPYNSGSRITVKYSDFAEGRKLIIPVFVLNTAKTEATNVVVELDYPDDAKGFVIPGDRGELRQDGDRKTIVHRFDAVGFGDRTVFAESVDVSQLAENRDRSLRVPYRIRCDEVDEVFEGVLTVYLKPE